MKSNPRFINAKGFDPRSSQKYFLDTNVWLYLYYPQSGSSSEKLISIYSEMLESMLNRECLLVTNLIQISEVVNAIFQIEKRGKAPSKKIKEFRESDEGKDALRFAKSVVQNITRYSTLRDGSFGLEEMEDMVKKCDKADFNDIYFYHFCKKEQAQIVTHDFDFNALEEELTIITANLRYGIR